MTVMKAHFETAFSFQGDKLELPVADIASALPFYQRVMGFELLARTESPPRSARLGRDAIEIGLAENGGDPEQNGCFFGVDSVEAAFAELQANGLGQSEANFRIDAHGDKKFKVFFVVAPDGLCFCLGEDVTDTEG
jgi:catechol 2,3-dioxygenase-like lactoylglutathione lyase family enzyme